MRFLLGGRSELYSLDAEEGGIEDLGTFTHPEGRQLFALAGSSDRARVVAGFHKGGAFLSDDGGKTWSDLTHPLGLDEVDVRSCAIDPNDNDTIYIGTNPPAIYVTNDAGKSWRELDGLRQHENAGVWSHPRGIPHVRAIAVSPHDSQTLFAGIEVGDLLKSEDCGETWRALPGVCRDIHKIIPLATDPGRVLLMTGNDSAPYKGEFGYGYFTSSDGGETWVEENDNVHLDKRVYCEDAFNALPHPSKTLFMAIADGTPPNWRGPRSLDAFFNPPSAEKRASGADVSIHRSIDAGQTWEKLNGRGGLPDHLFDAVWSLDVKASDQGAVVCFGTTAGDVWRSLDGGESWATLPKRLPYVSHVLLL